MLGYLQQIIAKSFGCLCQQKVAEDGCSWHKDHEHSTCVSCVSPCGELKWLSYLDLTVAQKVISSLLYSACIADIK